MWRTTFQRAGLCVVFLLSVALLAAGVWRYGFRQAVDQLAQRSDADLALASDRLLSQLLRYQELAVLLSDHPTVVQALNGDPGAVTQVLLSAADKTAAWDVLLVDRAGHVLSAARGSEMIPNMAYERALQGALGRAHLTAPDGQRRYQLAAPIFTPHGGVLGMVVVVVDIANIELDWRGTNPAVFFTDQTGQVFVTNRPGVLGWRSGDLSPPGGGVEAIRVTQLGPHQLWSLGGAGAGQPALPARALLSTRALPAIGMTGGALSDLAPAYRLAALQAAAVAAICLAFGALLFLAAERRRALARLNTELEARVARRTVALTQTNTQLRREVAERREAEAALKRAQADLVQAEKLSAMGRMSAGISHELNQPLMALDQFAQNGATYLERGNADKARENLGRISEMAGRMARIIRNLRAFARQETEPPGQVDVTKALAAALELAEPRLREAGVTLRYAPRGAPLWVTGGEVRLTQVFVNLITNAADAMQTQEARVLEIQLRDHPGPTILFRDTGPGIETPGKLFEPFYSTKPAGKAEGLGLGLSISYGIVQSFGGEIRGRNHPEGGAEFTVILPAWHEEDAA